MWRKFIADEKVYQFEFGPKMVTGDQITSILSVDGANGIVADRATFSGSRVTLWLSGGTSPGLCTITCIVKTTLQESLELQSPIQLLA